MMIGGIRLAMTLVSLLMFTFIPTPSGCQWHCCRCRRWFMILLLMMLLMPVLQTVSKVIVAVAVVDVGAATTAAIPCPPGIIAPFLGVVAAVGTNNRGG